MKIISTMKKFMHKTTERISQNFRSNVNDERKNQIHVFDNTVFIYFFHWTKQGGNTPAIVILDESINGDGRKSVTNNIENVCSYISFIEKIDLTDRVIVYRDTQQTYDQVIAQSFNFTFGDGVHSFQKSKPAYYHCSFRSLNVRTSYEAAVVKATIITNHNKTNQK